MPIPFHKMHALGNDFVIIDIDNARHNDIYNPHFIRYICNRKLGIGCDLVMLYRYHDGVINTRFFNQDGSEAEICGNGARCLGQLIMSSHNIHECILQTQHRSYAIKLLDENISVNMGKPSFDPIDIGINGTIDSLRREFFDDMFCISIGNPHLVIFPQERLSPHDIAHIGAQLESHKLFNNRINVSFAYVTYSGIDLTVFERGVGVTLACGSGACATAYIAYKNNFVPNNNIVVRQQGGDINVSIDQDQNIWQTGRATYVFRGEL